MSGVPCVFIDTNVLLDVLWKRKSSSLELLRMLKQNKMLIYTSYLVVLELIDKEQEMTYADKLLKEKKTLDYILRNRKNRRITIEERKRAIDKVYEILKECDINLLVPSDEGIWEIAILVMKDINVEASDAFHIASAIEAGCGIFITNDQRLGTQVKRVEGLDWYTPDKYLETLTS